jgi:Lantibiotic biosynthesis dehydratase C-term
MKSFLNKPNYLLNNFTIQQHNMTRLNHIHTTEWLAARFYHAAPWDTFLSKSLKPFVASAIGSGVAEKYWFERCMDGMPHICLYFRGKSGWIDSILRPNLQIHFNGYFETKPTYDFSTAYNAPKGISEHIQVSTFMPDISIYGGTVGFSIALRHLENSGNEVLRRIAAPNTWSLEDAWQNGLRMHLDFAQMAGLNARETSQLFKLLILKYFPEHKKQRYESTFLGKVLLSQQINQFVLNIWQDAVPTQEITPAYQDWLQSCAQTATDFQELVCLQNEPFLLEIFGQLIRKTNSQLGITGAHEAALFNAIAEGLSD